MPTDEAALGSAHQGDAARGDSIPWALTGLVSGTLGATVVALFFLVLDTANGQPLWTPTTLGSALFRGEMLPPGAPAEASLVAGYTAIHAAVFLGLGLIAAFFLMNKEEKAGPAWAGGVAIALFAGTEISFLIFAGLFEPALVGELGAGWVAFANVLAAVAMSLFLVAFDSRSRRTRPA